MKVTGKQPDYNTEQPSPKNKPKLDAKQEKVDAQKKEINDLDCSNCSALQQLPELPNVQKLDFSNMSSLTKLPPEDPNTGG